MTPEKSARFLFGLLGLVGEVEGDKRMFREKAQKGRGLDGLSGSGQHDHRPRLRGALQAGFNSAWNPHMQNIRYNRILCTPCRPPKGPSCSRPSIYSGECQIKENCSGANPVMLMSPFPLLTDCHRSVTLSVCSDLNNISDLLRPARSRREVLFLGLRGRKRGADGPVQAVFEESPLHSSA